MKLAPWYYTWFTALAVPLVLVPAEAFAQRGGRPGGAFAGAGFAGAGGYNPRYGGFGPYYPGRLPYYYNGTFPFYYYSWYTSPITNPNPIIINVEAPQRSMRAESSGSAGEEKSTNPMIQGKRLDEWVAQLKSKDRRQKIQALGAVGEAGANAGAAIPDVIRLLGDKDTQVRVAAVNTCIQLGPDVATDLINVLKGNDKLARPGAAAALGFMDEAAELVAPALLAVVRDPDPSVSAEAAQSMIRLAKAKGFDRKTIVPPLVKGLKHDDPQVRRGVAYALGRIGPDAKDAYGALKDALEDQDWLVRIEAALAMWRIQPPAESALKVLEAALNEKSGIIRGTAAACLAEIGPPCKCAQETLTKLAADEDPGIAHAATMALSQIGPDTIPALSKLMTAERPDHRWNALVALAQMQGETAARAKAMAPALIDDDEHVGEFAVSTLSKMGASAVPTLAAILDGSNKLARSRAMMALRTMDRLPSETVPILRTVLKDPDPAMRAAAAASLGRAGAPAQPAVGDLAAALKDKAVGVRRAAAAALGDLGPLAKSAVGALEAARKDEDHLVGDLATDALKRIADE